jgi:hypothetical protein
VFGNLFENETFSEEIAEARFGNIPKVSIE